MENRILEVAKVFFKLGCFAFGGPAAHISMMQDEIITKRKWMSEQHFLDLIGSTNLIPGPNSTEMTMHCGYERAGKIGLFVAGLCFIIPAILITGTLAFIYTNYGSLPQVEPFFAGIKPVVLVIILSAVIKLSKKAVKGVKMAVFGAIILVVCLFGVNEILLLISAGLLGGTIFHFSKQKIENDGEKNNGILPFLLLNTTSVALFPSISVGKIFLVFLKVGAILYGSGYVLFAYLDAELVAKGWLTHQQLMDAIAAGQFTPGPVLSTATFIGYQLGGFSGAIASTAGIFLPSFLFVLLFQPLIPKMQKSPFFRSILDCINVAAVAVMGAVLIEMGVGSLLGWKPVAIMLLSAFLVFKYKKISTVYVVLIGAGLGYVLNFI